MDDEKRRTSEDNSVLSPTVDGTAKSSTELSSTPRNETESPSNPPVPEGDSEHEYITGVKLLLAMTSITLIVFLMLLDTSIITTAIPQITSDFNSLPDVGWYGSSYLLATCAIQPLTGRVYSNFSSKITFLCFLGIFELGSVLCGAANSSMMLILGRTVAGMGASGMVGGALTIIGASLPLHKRPPMIGIMMGCAQMGIVIGPLIGGAFTQYVTWRWCFYINLPIGGLAALLLLLIKIPDRVDRSSSRPPLGKILASLDFFGFFLFAPFAVMLLLALQWGGVDHAWNSAIIIGLFSGSGSLLLVFLAWEYRTGRDAMIPFYMIRQRTIWASCLTIFFFYGSLIITNYYVPIYFQTVRGASASLSGVYLLPMILSILVAAVGSGILAGKMGYYLPWIIASGVFQTIGMGLMTTFDSNTSTGKWIGYQIIAGFGRGLGFQMPILAVQACLSPTEIPVGMSVVVFSQTFGGAVLLALSQLVFSSGLRSGLEEHASFIDPQIVIDAGATAVRHVISAVDLPAVLEAYVVAIAQVLYLATGASGAVFLFSLGMGWKSLKKEKVPDPAASVEGVEPGKTEEVV